MIFQTSIVSEISEYVEKLPENKQKKLLQALQKEATFNEAWQINKSVKKNNITMDEIVAVVRDVRKKRYNAGKQIRS